MSIRRSIIAQGRGEGPPSAVYDIGFNFRQFLAYGDDSEWPGNNFVDVAYTYPTAFTAHDATQVQAGWVTSPSDARDRNNTVDVPLRGMHYENNITPAYHDFRVDVVQGNYDFFYAGGEYATGGQAPSYELWDGDPDSGGSQLIPRTEGVTSGEPNGTYMAADGSLFTAAEFNADRYALPVINIDVAQYVTLRYWSRHTNSSSWFSRITHFQLRRPQP